MFTKNAESYVFQFYQRDGFKQNSYECEHFVGKEMQKKIPKLMPIYIVDRTSIYDIIFLQKTV